MKNIAFRFSKYHFPNAFLEHPSFSKSDWFFTSQNSSAGQACIVNMAKRRLAFPFSSFPFPVFSHCLSPIFPSARRVLWFFTSFFNFVQFYGLVLPFYGLVCVESLKGGWDCSSSSWYLRLSDSTIGFQLRLCLSHSLLPAMLCSLWSIFGKKMTCSGKKKLSSSQTWKQNLPRN